MVSARDRFAEIDLQLYVDQMDDSITAMAEALRDGDLEDAETQIDDALDYAKNFIDDLGSLRRHMKAEQESA
jgi:hypothetical protein